jgi:hypothetical protein
MFFVKQNNYLDDLHLVDRRERVRTDCFSMSLTTSRKTTSFFSMPVYSPEKNENRKVFFKE